MTTLKELEKKIEDLQERVKKLEELVGAFEDPEEKAYMEQLYVAAKLLVIKHQKASVMFLQKKLLIDFQRASKLMEQLQINNIIDAEGKIVTS